MGSATDNRVTVGCSSKIPCEEGWSDDTVVYTCFGDSSAASPGYNDVNCVKVECHALVDVPGESSCFPRDVVCSYGVARTPVLFAVTCEPDEVGARYFLPVVHCEVTCVPVVEAGVLPTDSGIVIVVVNIVPGVECRKVCHTRAGVK